MNNMRQINFLQPNVKLPFSEVSGSFAYRQQKAAELVDKLYRDLMPKFRHGELPFDEVKLSVKNVLKGRGRVRVIHDEHGEYMGASYFTFSEYTCSISGQTLEMPPKIKKLTPCDLITVLHEFQHIADALFHPKYMARTQFLYLTNLFPSKELDRYTENVLYKVEYPKNVKDKVHKLKIFKQKTLKFLEDKTIEEQIDLLQDSRKFLQTEIQAYKTQLKYAKKLAKKGYDISNDDLQHCERKMLLQEKLDILTHIAADIIKGERAKMK